MDSSPPFPLKYFSPLDHANCVLILFLFALFSSLFSDWLVWLNLIGSCHLMCTLFKIFESILLVYDVMFSSSFSFHWKVCRSVLRDWKGLVMSVALTEQLVWKGLALHWLFWPSARCTTALVISLAVLLLDSKAQWKESNTKWRSHFSRKSFLHITWRNL